MENENIGSGTRSLNIICDTDKNVRDFYVVNPVGDANSIFISNSEISAMLDFGGNKLDSFCKEQLAFSNIFILSHYHKDHYEGLLQLKKERLKKLRIEQLYYPVLPEISDEKALIQKLLVFSFCLGDDSGCPEVDLVKLIQELNGDGIKLNYTPVAKGRNIKIGSSKYEVIWPPEKISPENNKSIFSKIKKIRDEINSNPVLKSLWNEVNKLKFTGNDYHSFSIDFERVSKPINDINKTFSTEINDATFKKVKDSIVSKICKVTNSLSICLYKKNEFLSFGDLESDDIKECTSQLTYDKNSAYIPVKYFITAHHGTHYHEFCQYIKADYVISSNGSRMKNQFKSEYKNCGRYCHNTCDDGIFANSEVMRLSTGIVASIDGVKEVTNLGDMISKGIICVIR